MLKAKRKFKIWIDTDYKGMLYIWKIGEKEPYFFGKLAA